MTVLLKNAIKEEFRKGLTVPVLAEKYGFTNNCILKIINPNFSKNTVVISKISVIKPEESKEFLKKKRQKEAGVKAAETRRKNKQLAKVIPITTVVKEKTKVELLKEFTDTLYKIGELLLTK